MLATVSPRRLAAAVLLAAIPTTATASTVTLFEETFDAEIAPGTQVPNFTAFDSFFVDKGSVDMLHTSPPCDAGGCVDLDGSTQSGGTISTGSLAFVGGKDYQLTFRLAGPRDGPPGSEIVEFGIGKGVLSVQSLTIQRDEGFREVSVSFVAPFTGLGSLFFRNLGGDDFGAILDDVRIVHAVTPVPLPAGLPVFALALAGLALGARQRSAMSG